MPVDHVPAGSRAVTPYLICAGASDAIAYYQRVLGAAETYRMATPDGRVGHAELQLGDSKVMLADAFPEVGVHAPPHYGGTPVSLLLYVPDVDATVARAVAAGAEVERPLQDQFYGDRTATLRDPFGHRWTIATHVEDVTPDELERRAKAGGRQPADD